MADPMSRRSRGILCASATLVAAMAAVTVLVIAVHRPTAVVAVSPPSALQAAVPAVSTPAADPTAAPPGSRAIFPRPGGEPQSGQSWFLVVGDSISFGLTVDPSRFGTNSSWAVQLQPLLRASGRSWVADDLACPGETTVSYASSCPMAVLAPWLGGASQRSTALTAVHEHASTLRFIAVELGANDLLNARRDGTAAPTVLAGLRTRLATIVSDLAAQVPGVPIVIANLYDPYGPADVTAAAAVDAANAVIADVAASRGAVIADWHAAVNGSTESLSALVDRGHNDVHPTVEGHRVLALSVMAALARAGISPMPAGAPLAEGAGSR
jgi:lysophospholipase L1-like esterase